MSVEFPKQNGVELVFLYIHCELSKAGISVHQSSMDGTIITDKEVPEAIMLSLCQYAANKGITIKFQTSDYKPLM